MVTRVSFGIWCDDVSLACNLMPMTPGSDSSGHVLLVACLETGDAVGGRALLSRLIKDALASEFESGLAIEVLRRSSPKGIKDAFGGFAGNIDGLDKTAIRRILRLIVEKRVGKVVIDGSNLGTLAKAIKNACPGVEVSTFFHNCEARFFLGAFRQTRSLRSLGILAANYLAERRAVGFSDKRICLSERDSALLRKVYGRGATHISAMAMQDSLPTAATGDAGSMHSKYALFVGGIFYANRAGIAWFCQNVAPRISMKTCVVGKGFHAFKDELERHGNVEVIGEVDSLAPWYVNAHVVVAPIFDGSGMKTKVAEALMFGKRVVGTAEAFSGYEEIAQSVGQVCKDAEEFIAAMEREAGRGFVALDPELRAIYDERYSFPAACARLRNILGPLAVPGADR